MLNYRIKVKGIVDGFIKAEITSVLGDVSRRQFSQAAFEEYVEAKQLYCDHKGYGLEVDDTLLKEDN